MAKKYYELTDLINDYERLRKQKIDLIKMQNMTDLGELVALHHIESALLDLYKELMIYKAIG